ncbi:unnamed protein product [Ranitomeya imitator]|uniref:Olfactory receptor n=1 Tax=Ranitomeya imitator TaxID=111125 RepID=A0ABN9KYW4_9NEOB|nr:unnamed protein product [Ranitomeya imitator]
MLDLFFQVIEHIYTTLVFMEIVLEESSRAVIVLLIYCMTICENLLIICLVSTSHRLHSPMYFFLGHLALSDIILVTNIVPKMLDVVVKNGSVMRFAECLAQFYIYGVIICVECFLLAAMSYDRYLAICKPLHYNSIMNVMLKYRLTVSSWALSFMLESISLVLVCRLDFCGPNVINHFFCDYAPLLQLSCSDTSAPEIEMFVLSFPIIVLPFLFVITTYVYIFHTIFGIRSTSTSGWQKTFSTCSPHLAVVSTFYGSILIIYMVPYREHSMKAIDPRLFMIIGRFHSTRLLRYSGFAKPDSTLKK